VTSQAMIGAIASAGFGWRPSLTTSATLIGWYEARSDLVTLAGSDVTQVDNRVSGGANPLVQLTSINRGAWSTSNWGSGKGSIDFDGSTDCMTAHGLAASVTGTDQPFTILLLGQLLSLTSTGGTIRSLCGFGNTSDDNPLHDLRRPAGTTTTLSSGRRDSAAVAKIKDAAAALTSNRTMWSLVFNGTKTKLRTNGVLDTNLDGVSSTADNDVDALTGLNTFTVGALSRTIVSGNVDLRFAAMLVFAGALSDAELALNERYLKIGHPL
jgi:hypothetical protein